MPFPDREGSRKPYYQHDDRGDLRTVRYRGGGGGGGGGRRKYRPGKPNFDDEGDVTMGGESEQGGRRSRFNPYKSRDRKGNRRRPGGGGNNNNNNNAAQGSSYNSNRDRRDGRWFKITVPYGVKMDKSFVLKSLGEICSLPFVPYHYHVDGNSSVFFVEDPDVAKTIFRTSTKITTPDGFKLKTYINPCPPPDMPLDDTVLERIKVVMSKRFDAAMNALNLSRFHQDLDLRQQGIYAALNKPKILVAVVKIIEEHIPQLVALDLTGNRLQSLDQLSSLATKAKLLKVLILAENNLTNVTDLDNVKELPIEELTLDKNPLCDSFDQTTYISVIRQRFPKITRLDGHDLPPQYGFDVGNETSLPPSQGNFFINETSRGIVPTFLEQYFTAYDSDRQRLSEAYHDESMFSLSVAYKGTSTVGLKDYVLESRNLMRINGFGKRMKLLHQGKFNIVSFLCQLPKTQHDPASFSVDVIHISPTLITFSCSGIFKEANSRGNNSLKAFSRVFAVIPQGAGFCIVNEMLYISVPTAEQNKVAFKTPAPTPSPSPVPPAVPLNVPSPEQQQQMIIAFSQQSGMNMDWSLKCLQENDWDFDKAAFVFQELSKVQRVPPAAFVK